MRVELKLIENNEYEDTVRVICDNNGQLLSRGRKLKSKTFLA